MYFFFFRMILRFNLSNYTKLSNPVDGLWCECSQVHIAVARWAEYRAFIQDVLRCLLVRTTCARQALPRVWRKATTIAIPKPNKPAENPKNSRRISLLCVPFKMLERLLLGHLEPVVDPQLLKEQAGFRSLHCPSNLAANR